MILIFKTKKDERTNKGRDGVGVGEVMWGYVLEGIRESGTEGRVGGSKVGQGVEYLGARDSESIGIALSGVLGEVGTAWC